MEKLIRFNDTLRLSVEQGFPAELDIQRHFEHSYQSQDFNGKVFTFQKPLPRLYPLPPTRTFLVQDVAGLWLPWGHCLVSEQTITQNGEATIGKFMIIKLYTPAYMKAFAENDVPAGKSYFDAHPLAI
jgi:hypothetical protein